MSVNQSQSQSDERVHASAMSERSHLRVSELKRVSSNELSGERLHADQNEDELESKIHAQIHAYTQRENNNRVNNSELKSMNDFSSQNRINNSHSLTRQSSNDSTNSNSSSSLTNLSSHARISSTSSQSSSLTNQSASLTNSESKNRFLSFTLPHSSSSLVIITHTDTQQIRQVMIEMREIDSSHLLTTFENAMKDYG